MKEKDAYTPKEILLLSMTYYKTKPIQEERPFNFNSVIFQENT